LDTPADIVQRLKSKRQLSVVERQELWLAQKTIRAEQMRSRIAGDAVEERAKTAPDLSRSKRSFRLASQEAIAVRGTTASSKRKLVARAVVSEDNDRRPPINESKEGNSFSAARRGSASLGNITNQKRRQR
jgi:hypothetical protein